MASVIRGSDNFDSAGGNAVKAWVNFNGTGTVAIRASYNVASITDNNTGDYTVNFTTALSDANYSLGLAGDGNSNYSASGMAIGIRGDVAPTASACRFITGSVGTGGAIAQDKALIYAQAFR